MNTKTRVFNLKEKVLYAIGQMPDTATACEMIEKVMFVRSFRQEVVETDTGKAAPTDEVEAKFIEKK